MRVILLLVFILTAFICSEAKAGVVILEDGSLFEGEAIQGKVNEFKVEDGHIKMFSNSIFKVVKTETRKPTDEEAKKLIKFKTSDYDVTFDEKGSFSSSLNSFEEKIGKRLQQVFDGNPNLSDKECIEIVSKEFNLPITIIDHIFLKAALETGGRL